MFATRRLWHSFRHAARGLRYAWRVEQNFRLQAFLGLAALLGALLLGLPFLHVAILVLLAVLVLVLELLNTFFEQLMDLVSPRLHHAVGSLKDLLAAAVLVAAAGAAAGGALLFWPYLW
jgi:diacylglycerol kinase (ATP)